MKYSVILVDLKNQLNIYDCYNYYSQYFEDDFEIIYCTSKAKDCPLNVVNYIFDEANIESVINAVTSKCNHNNIAVVRNPMDFKRVIDLAQNHICSNQIVYLKKKQTKLSNIVLRFQKFIGKFFIHKIYDINYSVILYGEISSKVLKNVASPTILMKTNNWEGIQMVGVEGGSKYKFVYDKKRLAIKTLLPIIVALILIPLFFVIRPKTFRTIKVIYLLVILILFVVGAIFGAKWILNSIVGENITNKAKILNEKGD